MDESEWLTSKDPVAMLACLDGHTGRMADGSRLRWAVEPSARKLRLFAVACCRQLWSRLTDAQRVQVVFAEEELWHQAAAAGAHPEFLSEDALEDYTGTVGAERCVRYALSWLCAANASEVASQAPAWLQKLMLFGTQAALLRDIVGNPFRPVVLPGGREMVGVVSGRDGGEFYPAGAGVYRVAECSWLTPTVLSLAWAAYEERRRQVSCRACSGEGCSGNVGYLDDPKQRCDGSGRRWVEDGALDPFRLALVADALEEAGCPAEEAVTESMVAGHCCPWCGDAGFWRSGQEFDHMKKCRRQGCGRVWVPESDRVGVVRRRPHRLLAHMRSEGPHYRGMWSLDTVLGLA